VENEFFQFSTAAMLRGASQEFLRRMFKRPVSVIDVNIKTIPPAS
jgi:hypothetical protein